MGIQGISGAMAYAIKGIRGSIDHFDKAVTNVVRAGAAMSDFTQFSAEALAKAGASAGPEPSLERGLVDQRLALHELKANIAVIQTADDMQEALVQIGSRSHR